jgi:hypothetical protein
MKIEEMVYGQMYDGIPDGVDTSKYAHAKRSIRIPSPAGDVVLCNPTYPQVRQWRKLAMPVDGNMGEAFETLFRATALTSGNAPNVNALLDDWGGIPTSNEAIAAMRVLSGMAQDDAKKA